MPDDTAFRLRRLFWEATPQCNLRCLHCGSGCGTEPPGDILSTDEITSFWDEVYESFSPQGMMLCITGGEPLLRGDLLSVMRHAAELGFDWGMTTNGTLITPDTLRGLHEAGMQTVAVSVDGLREAHNYLRGENCFDEALGAARLLAGCGLFNHVQITTVVYKGNIGQLGEMYELFSRTGIASWKLINIEPIGRALHNDELFLSRGEYRTLFDFIARCRGSRSAPRVTYGCSHYLTPEYEGRLRDGRFGCLCGTAVASVTYDGDIFPCLDLERRPEYVQGNIRRDAFAEIWRDGFKLFRQPEYRMDERCRCCSEARACLGDSAHTWDYDTRRPRICMKEILKEADR